MFGKRCSLCGGKLNSQMICKECGLDNSKSERYYKINKSSCDRQPLTHVHEDRKYNTNNEKTEKQQYTNYGKPEKSRTGKKPEQYTWQSTSGNVGKQKKARWVGRAVTAFVILSIVGTVIGSMAGIVLEKISDSGNIYEESDPYEMVVENGYELQPDGDEAEFYLTSGKYIVGVHIPEGNYEANEMEEYDVIKVNDREHSLFLYEYPGKEGISHLNDLWLFEGAFLEVSAEDTVYLRTENAKYVTETPNPLTESYEFEGNVEKTAGIDFEAGVYDLSAVNGWGRVEINIYDNEFDEEYPFATENIDIGEGMSNGSNYKNVILPEGAKLITEDYDEGDEESFVMAMTPSPVIESTDYLQTYKESY